MATDIVGSKFGSLASDQIKLTPRGYGQNGPQPSSLRPGETAPHALDIAKPDSVLASVQASGSRSPHSANLSREMAPGNVPTNRAMNSPGPNPTVPASLIDAQGDYVRRPTYETSKFK